MLEAARLLFALDDPDVPGATADGELRSGLAARGDFEGVGAGGARLPVESADAERAGGRNDPEEEGG